MAEKGSQGLVVLGVVAVIVIAASKFSSPAPAPLVDPTPKPSATGVPDWKRFAVAERRVREMLRDPESATFHGERVSSKLGTPVVCGTVNAKNGFGGMTGDQRFISGGATALEEQMAKGEMDRAWAGAC